MFNIKLKLTAALMLSALTLASCAGGGAAPASTDVLTQTEPGETTTKSEYDYPNADYKGYKLRILNFDNIWNMYIHIDQEEMTGEALDDAVYTRNRSVESRLNCVIKEIKEPYVDYATSVTGGTKGINDIAKKSIMAGEDAYDVMYLMINKDISLITNGYLLDLAEIPELSLDKPWWDSRINDTVTFNGKLYNAAGMLNYMALDSAWCMFLNEKLMDSYKLEKPYDLVREGKWTLDALLPYIKAVVNLNGDASFTWSQTGKCVYGISAHQSTPAYMMYCCGEQYVTNDGSKISFVLGSERFHSMAEKLAVVMKKTEGSTLFASNTDLDAAAGGYVYVFMNDRALFMTGEIKSALVMRGMESTFGIVPMPKYDENQENYGSSVVVDLMYYTIPTTNPDVSRTAVISDALTYESYRDVLPIYYDVTVSQKGLRNEESIEMLGIIRDNRGIDLATVFSWNTALKSAFVNAMFAGDASTLSSSIESNKAAIIAAITKFEDTFKG